MAKCVNGTHLALEMERQPRYAVHAGSDAGMDSVGERLSSNAQLALEPCQSFIRLHFVCRLHRAHLYP